MTLSVTQTFCLNLSLSKVDALTWSESHTFTLSSFHLELGRTHTHCHSARIERGCIIISWTSIYLIEVTRQLGNFDVPLFNMHLNISVKPRKPCHALEKSHHLRSGRRAEWRRPTPTTMARKRGVSWMFHVQEGDFHEIIFLQSLCGLNGKEQCWQWLCTSTSASHRNPDANVRFDGIVTPPITTMHPGK